MIFVIYPFRKDPVRIQEPFRAHTAPKQLDSSLSLITAVPILRRLSVAVFAACCQRANLVIRQQYKPWSVFPFVLSSLFILLHPNIIKTLFVSSVLILNNFNLSLKLKILILIVKLNYYNKNFRSLCRVAK